MEVDRRAFLATVGVGALEVMSPEDKAEELEHYMIHMLDDHDEHDSEEPLSEEEQEAQALLDKALGEFKTQALEKGSEVVVD